MSNTSGLDDLILAKQVSLSFYLAAVQISIYRIVTLLCIVGKCVYNHETFMENQVLIFYFLLLFVGNGLIAGVEAWTAQAMAREVEFIPVADVLNIVMALGVLCIGAFFGLVPNLFYSIYKTTLTKAEGFTKIYFSINSGVIGVFFVITLVFNFLGAAYLYLANVMVILEILYTVVFYLVALRALSHLEIKKMFRFLLKFFLYYLCYAVVQIVRCSCIIYTFNQDSSSNGHVSQWTISIMDCVMNGVLTVVIVLFLREFKLKSNKERFSTRKETITQ